MSRRWREAPPGQLTFADRPRRDGRPRGRAGRPKKEGKPAVSHDARPEHDRRKPVHVTLRAVQGLPSFRAQVLYPAFLKAFRKTRRDDFRIVEFSVQKNHVHLLVEAETKEALSRGMASFAVRANRLFNAALGRGRGRVWGERYHGRALGSPREVRHALVYVLNNVRKHQGITSSRPVVDPCSSGPWFSGWATLQAIDGVDRPTEPPTTFLLEKGWKMHGYLSPTETPKSTPHRRSS